jgi:asparagine N-glycosylation enzyme membrane subunit Stt3
MRRDERKSGQESSRERWAAAAIGALFIAIAVSIPFASGGDLGVMAWFAVGVIAGLGLEALISAARNRRCLLSRIGPLP